MEKFDLVVLGAGPAGVAAATAAALRGMTACLISGGVFLGYGLEGAFKSKSLYEIARSYHSVRNQWGLVSGDHEVDFGALSAGNTAGAEALRAVRQAELLELGITTIQGNGRFTDPHTLIVDGEREVHGEFVLIATGTRPRMLPGMLPDGERILTSDHVVKLARPLSTLLILGAGVIGCEFASIFASLGSKVTLVDTKERIFAHDDPDVSDLLCASFDRMGVTVIPSARCKGMKVSDGQVHTDLGRDEPVVTDAAILSVGRVPNTQNLGLGKAGVECGARDYIPTSNSMQTNVPHIYAAGDVGHRDSEHDLSLVHIGEAEGRQAVGHMAGGGNVLDTDYVPFIIFTIPMVAGAGLSETEARKRFPNLRMATWLNERNHRSHAMKSKEGFVKLLVGPEGDDRILGLRAVGQGVDTAVGQVSIMIQHGLPYTHLLDSTQAHPSLAESLQGAARILAGQAPT
ncbi:MAG: NAD(P)/FAD-dependent oxidoreductase [Planctomycetes bacterium]|nr:NAD(P)/FAD-dependent oxidoreductase [Planctomycetota bacterium]